MSEVNIIVDGKNSVRLNQREWQETIIQAIPANTHHLQKLSENYAKLHKIVGFNKHVSEVATSSGTPMSGQRMLEGGGEGCE